MRRLKKREDGAISVMMALLMVILLGITAIVVDIGLVYVERAQLQNGADAAAIAIAQDCAASTNCTTTAGATALRLAGANSNDGRSEATYTVNNTTRTVTVETRTLTADGGSRLQHWFAPVLGIDSTQVQATATAGWGSPIAGPAIFPVVFSECEVRQTNEVQVVMATEKNAPSGCAGGPPGGFGILDRVNDECSAVIDVEEFSVGSDTGNKGVPGCDDLLDSWEKSILNGTYPTGLFPIYKSVNGQGTKATYGLAGLATFEIYGWQLKKGGNTTQEFRPRYYPGLDCGKEICLIGKFIKHVSLDDADYTLGPVNAFGTTIVQLTE